MWYLTVSIPDLCNLITFMEKDRLYITLMTLGPDLCQLVLVLLMTLVSELLHSGGIFLEVTTGPNSK